MNYYKRHIGDFTKATGHLSQGQVGAYDLLLDWYYSNERPLPLDQECLYRIGRAHDRAEKKNVDLVLSEFFTRTEDGYRHKRVEEEIEQASRKSSKAADSANARWAAMRSQESQNTDAMQTHDGHDANAMRTHSERNATPLLHYSITPKSKSTIGSPDGDATDRAGDRFDEFWGVYPRLEAKARALKAWKAKRIGARPGLAERIIEDVKDRKARHRPWLDGFVPHASTYLNGERWEDPISMAPAARAGPLEQRPVGKTASAIMALEQRKREREQAEQNTAPDLVPERDIDWPTAAACAGA